MNVSKCWDSTMDDVVTWQLQIGPLPWMSRGHLAEATYAWAIRLCIFLHYINIHIYIYIYIYVYIQIYTHPHTHMHTVACMIQLYTPGPCLVFMGKRWFSTSEGPEDWNHVVGFGPFLTGPKLDRNVFHVSSVQTFPEHLASAIWSASKQN